MAGGWWDTAGHNQVSITLSHTHTGEQTTHLAPQLRLMKIFFRNTDRSYNYSSGPSVSSPYVSRRTTIPTRGLSIPPSQPSVPTRGLSIPPAGLTSRSIRQRTVARLTERDDVSLCEDRSGREYNSHFDVWQEFHLPPPGMLSLDNRQIIAEI